MQIRAEKKKQVYLLAALTVLLIGIASWELLGTASTQAAGVSTTPSRSSGVGSHAPSVSHVSLAGDTSEPQLRLSQIFRTEKMEYSSTGRNIFSIEAAPVAIETPIASPRPVEVAAAVPAPRPAPAIDLKYIGYTRNVGDAAYRAVVSHKDETLMAMAGDIVFHRYKVVSVQPTAIQVTDLSYKNTQSLPIIEK